MTLSTVDKSMRTGQQTALDVQTEVRVSYISGSHGGDHDDSFAGHWNVPSGGSKRTKKD
jgi:hypothetical protein